MVTNKIPIFLFSLVHQSPEVLQKGQDLRRILPPTVARPPQQLGKLEHQRRISKGQTSDLGAIRKMWPLQQQPPQPRPQLPPKRPDEAITIRVRSLLIFLAFNAFFKVK